ncbi:MAG: hypothetical protein IJ560_01525 [Alphaproteobacteria bacterium]|nr:hypothetical protein [Alphaproteobacteria bacterium]
MDTLNLSIAVRLLRNSGFNVLGADSAFLYLEDPSCILRSFQTFAEYMWIIICCITGILLFGWGISLIRGAKNDIFTNMRNLALIFGILGAAGPIINTIYGDNLFGRGCNTIKISQSAVAELLDARNATLNKHGKNELYEEFDMYDSGPTYYDEDIFDTNVMDDYPDDAIADTPTVVRDGTPPSHDDTHLTSDGGAGIGTTTTAPHNASNGTSRNEVIYTRPDGSRYKHVGGSRAWRNNNPGNLRGGDTSIGTAGGFAVFASESDGMRALHKLLRTPNYQRLSILDAMKRYAPASDNNRPVQYAQKIASRAGVSINTKLSQLNDTQMDAVANTIRTVEGWTPGKIVEM